MTSAGGGYRWLNGTGLHARDVTDTADFRLVTHTPPPDWVADQIGYQIFPDRFARSGIRRSAPIWAEPADWSEPVAHRGDRAGAQWFGGDLAGIVTHLDHLTDLGATLVYLTPIFESMSNHRYDATTFDHVDPLARRRRAFAQLLEATGRARLRVIGDLTTNHTGRGHVWFLAALEDPGSLEAGFYRFRGSPDDYATWLDTPSLPKLDHASPELRRRLYAGEHSVVARWLVRGLDGWRIDVANMTGRLDGEDLADMVARTVRATAEAAKPDAWLLAEHGHDASQDLMGAGWHGTMDYAGFTRPVWAWLNGGSCRGPGQLHGLHFLGLPVGVPVLPGDAMVATMRDVHAGHLVGLALQMTMPGVPVVYMGDEIGLTGVDGEHARTPVPWDRRDEWDHVTLQAYRDWIRLRREHVALRRGGLRWVHVAADSLTYLREHPAQRVLVHASRATCRTVELPLAPLRLTSAAQVHALRGEPVTATRPGVIGLTGIGPAAHVYLLEGLATSHRRPGSGWPQSRMRARTAHALRPRGSPSSPSTTARGGPTSVISSAMSTCPHRFPSRCTEPRRRVTPRGTAAAAPPLGSAAGSSRR